MSNQTDGWMTIREASFTLGVSELTVRRRIKDGRIAHRLVNGKYFVNLDGPPVEAAADPPAAAHTAGSRTVPEASSDGILGTGVAPVTGRLPGDEVAQLLTPLLQEQSRLAERAGRAALLAEQLQQAEQRYVDTQTAMVALASRNGWLEGKLEEREQEIKLLSDSRHRVPWWRRWFRNS